MKLLQTSLDLPAKGCVDLTMESTNNNRSLPLQASSSLDSSLEDSQLPLDLRDMPLLDGPNVVTYEPPTPDSSPSPNLVSGL